MDGGDFTDGLPGESYGAAAARRRYRRPGEREESHGVQQRCSNRNARNSGTARRTPLTQEGGVGTRGPRDWGVGGAGRGAGRRCSRKTKWKGPTSHPGQVEVQSLPSVFAMGSPQLRCVQCGFGQNSCGTATWLSPSCSPTKGIDRPFRLRRSQLRHGGRAAWLTCSSQAFRMQRWAPNQAVKESR